MSCGAYRDAASLTQLAATLVQALCGRRGGSETGDGLRRRLTLPSQQLALVLSMLSRSLSRGTHGRLPLAVETSSFSPDDLLTLTLAHETGFNCTQEGEDCTWSPLGVNTKGRALMRKAVRRRLASCRLALVKAVLTLRNARGRQTMDFDPVTEEI